MRALGLPGIEIFFYRCSWMQEPDLNRYYRIFIATLAAIFSGLLQAEETRYSMRELCRSEVNGVLLGAHNDVDMLSGLIKESEKKIVASEQRRKAVERELEQSQFKSPHSVPVFELDEKIVALRFESTALKEQILEAEQHLSSHRLDLQSKLNFRKQFEALLPPAFIVVKAPNVPAGAYNFRVEYKRVCGPYELLCPLTPEHSHGLQRILPKLSNPEWCRRYTQLKPL